MEIRIEYATNEQGWALERIAAQNGYTKTQDCYWTQIFENANGDSIVTTREKTVNGDPAAELTARLAPAPAAEEQEEQTAPIDGETQDDEQPTRYQRIKAYLDSLSDAKKVYVWNEYTDATNNPDDRIYSMEEFDEVFSGSKPWEIARTCYYSGQFCPADDWFWFDGYGNTASSDFPESTLSPYNADDIAQYIADNDENFYDDTIRAILDGEEVRA